MHRFFYTILVAVAILLGTAAPSYALDVEDIRYGVHPDKVRMVIEFSEAIEYRVFSLDSPYRIVIDIPEASWHAGKIEKPLASGVKNVRQALLQEGVTRIVVEVDFPFLIRSAFFLQAENGSPHRLVIDYKKVPVAEFSKGKGKVYGDMEVSFVSSSQTNEPVRKTRQTENVAHHPAAAPVPPSPARAGVKKAAVHGGTVIPPRRPPSKSLKKPVIVIDAGHGGKDPGAISRNGIYEKNVTLAMARQLKKALEQTGRYDVVLTRDNDRYLRLYQRVNYARDKGGDLFLSLHADSIEAGNVRGASIYTLSEKASDAQTARLAARENSADLIGGIDLSVEDPDVANILISLAMRDTMNQSKFFANTVVEELGRNKVNILSKPHRYAGFAVLKAPDIPSVLVEMGFMSNAQEANLLSSPSYRAKIVNALIDGIDAYFEKRRIEASH